MKIVLKYARKLDQEILKAGEHVVDDSLAKSWYFKALVKDGEIHVIEAPKKVEETEELPLEPVKNLDPVPQPRIEDPAKVILGDKKEEEEKKEPVKTESRSSRKVIAPQSTKGN